MTAKKKFIIGSRGSKLSLAYSIHVKNLLIKSNSLFDYSSIEIKIIKTSGDIFQNKRISDIGGKGVFCKQIEEELLESKIDLAVHSLKDLFELLKNASLGSFLFTTALTHNPSVIIVGKSFKEWTAKSIFDSSSSSSICLQNTPLPPISETLLF